MMSFQKLLFNLGLLFFANNLSYSEVIVLKAKNIPFQNFKLEDFLKTVAKNRDPDYLKFFPEPEKIKTYLDVQNAWLNWAKKARINTSIRQEAIHNFLPRIINSASPIKYTVPTKINISGTNKMELRITEPLHSGRKPEYPSSGTVKTSRGVIDPFGFSNGRVNYYDERFGEEWHLFWKEREKFALKNGYKSLDGYCLDTYSAWCEKKYNVPFYLLLKPHEVRHHAQFFRRSAHREFVYQGGKRIFYNEGLWNGGNSPPFTGGWHLTWEYTTFCVRWMLIFETWKNEKFTEEIRTGWIRELHIARKDGYPFRVSFDFSGTVLDFIDQSLQQYNGKDVKGYISLGGGTIVVSL